MRRSAIGVTAFGGYGETKVLRGWHGRTQNRAELDWQNAVEKTDGGLWQGTRPKESGSK